MHAVLSTTPMIEMVGLYLKSQHVLAVCTLHCVVYEKYTSRVVYRRIDHMGRFAMCMYPRHKQYYQMH